MHFGDPHAWVDVVCLILLLLSSFIFCDRLSRLLILIVVLYKNGFWIRWDGCVTPSYFIS